MSAFETRPLNPHFGVEVTGINLADAMRDRLFGQVRALFEEHSALLFRNQDISDDQHKTLAELFGPIEDRKADERKEGEEFEVPMVSNVRDDGSITEEMDLHTLNLKSNFLWHSDSTFLPNPALNQHSDRPSRNDRRWCDRTGQHPRGLGEHARDPQGKGTRTGHLAPVQPFAAQGISETGQAADVQQMAGPALERDLAQPGEWAQSALYRVTRIQNRWL